MSIKTILPTHIDKQINQLDIIGAKRLKELEDEVSIVKDFREPLKIEESFLEALADSYETEFWSDITPLEKRKMVRASQKFYRRVGTPSAVKQVLESLDIKSRLDEWWQYGANAYHFRVALNPQRAELIFDEKMFKRLIELIDKVKSIRSKLDGFLFELELTEKIVVQEATTLNIKLAGIATVDMEPATNINIAEATSLNIGVDKEAHYELNPVSTINLSNNKVLSVSLNGERSINVNAKSSKNIQGAVVWQV